MIAIEEKILEIEKTVNNNKLIVTEEHKINLFLDKINSIKIPIDKLSKLYAELDEVLYNYFEELTEENINDIEKIKIILSLTNKYITVCKNNKLYPNYKNSLKELIINVGNIKELVEDFEYKFSDNEARKIMFKKLAEL